jgi:transcriptional regulator with XRE-family HTH domain
MRAKYDTTFARLRKQAGLTQSELAAQAGIDIRNVQRMEAGEIDLKKTPLATALALAQAFGVEVEHLIDEPRSE